LFCILTGLDPIHASEYTNNPQTRDQQTVPDKSVTGVSIGANHEESTLLIKIIVPICVVVLGVSITAIVSSTRCCKGTKTTQFG